MRFQTELVPATLIRRYKRFLADIRLGDGREVTAHCPNPGAMTGLAEAGTRVWVEPNDDPRKKLKFGLRLVELPTGFVAVDTGLANRVVAEALADGVLPDLAGETRAEVAYGQGSRVDFRILQNGRPLWVEVKSVTLSRENGLAEFPDTRTARGAKHLDTLAGEAAKGARAVMLYLVGRSDCTQFRVARDIDPAYAEAEARADAAGVEFRVYATRLGPDGITLDPAQLPRS